MQGRKRSNRTGRLCASRSALIELLKDKLFER